MVPVTHTSYLRTATLLLTNSNKCNTRLHVQGVTNMHKSPVFIVRVNYLSPTLRYEIKINLQKKEKSKNKLI